MANTNNKKPDIIQSFDHYVDREYYKITQGFWGKSETKVRADRLENWIEWQIECEKMPDKIVVNGEEYNLSPSPSLAGEEE